MKINIFRKNNLMIAITLLFILSFSLGCSSKIYQKVDMNNQQFNLGEEINSSYDDFAPLLIEDNKLLFTSSKEAVCGYIPDKDFYGEDIFIASKVENEWQKAKFMEPPTNTYTNEGTIAQIVLNNNTSTIVAKSHDQNGFGDSDLYVAKYDNETLSNFKNLGEKFNTEYWEAHPTLSTDGKILVFASNRPGGFGGSDLYVSYKNDTTWSTPKNLGPKINTSTNELSPYLANNGNLVLFFSSETEDNSLDIYYIFQKGNEKWCNKELLSDDINTTFNDAFPCPTSDLKSIFFSSDRPGGNGGFDLYSAPLNLDRPCFSTLVKERVFDLRDYNIPFFVTGYYKLNTKENLKKLKKGLNGNLKDAKYIENPSEKYDAYANTLESIFEETIYYFVSEALLPAFFENKDEAIIFEIFGYTDPRTFSTGKSFYIEDNIEFENVSVSKGTLMTNEILANLRAYYTMVYLDQILSKNDDYLELKNSGKIKYKLEGKGIDSAKKSQDAKRRVQINIWKEILNK